jgi:Ca2+-binding EF-hand superfamily protein
MMDEDGDGIITKPEFLNYVLRNRKNVKANNIGSYFTKVLDPQNFRSLAESTSDNEIRFLVDKIFSSVDKDNNGSWSFDEVKDMVTMLA